MVTEIVMPQLGTTMTEGTVCLWKKAEGDFTKKGEPLLEIETDKYTSEILAEVDGYLRSIIVQEGEEVPVLAVLGLITSTLEEELPSTTAGVPPEKEPTTDELPAAKPADLAETTPTNMCTRVYATPLAKKTAKKLGVDISNVTTQHKRIKQEDVLWYHEERQTAVAKEEAVPASFVNVDQDTPDTVVPLTAMRRVIGSRMTESIVTAPQVTEMREVRADALMALRGRIMARNPDVRVSYGDIIAKMVATALTNLPAMNAHLLAKGIQRHSEVNIGVAVALEDGLVVPVVHDVDRKGICKIATESMALIKKARENCLTTDDTTGATFTISNLGGFGVDGFTPIVNLPECGILGLGRIVRKPVVDDNDQIVPGNVMTLSLTFDHRVVDGATAAKLLALISEYVENPEAMLL